MTVPYTQGSDLPDLAITWKDSAGNIIDFSTDWTFTVLVGRVGAEALITKTSGITGDDEAPNLVISWDENELDDLEPNNSYSVAITAKRTSDDKERKMATTIFIRDTVQEAAS